MKKAKTVSEWIMQKLNEGYYQYSIAYILNCSQSSVHNLIKMTHPNGELTQRAYDIIQHYDSSPQIENDDVKAEQEQIQQIKTNLTAVNKAVNEDILNLDIRVLAVEERLKDVEDKVVLLWGQVQRHEENIENIKGRITELREQIERSFEPIDDWKMEVLKQGSGIAKLEKIANNHSERPQIGIIRRFWRWLW
jgi:chromosome segregation ATPase